MDNYIKSEVDKTFNLIELATNVEDLKTIYRLHYFNTKFDENEYKKIKDFNTNEESLFHINIYIPFMIYKSAQSKTKRLKKKQKITNSEHERFNTLFSDWINTSLNKSLKMETNYRQELNKLLFAFGKLITNIKY